VYNYKHKAKAPYNKLNRKNLITNAKKCEIIGWVLVALDVKVRFYTTLRLFFKIFFAWQIQGRMKVHIDNYNIIF
jgi:hypothetical protein